MPTTEACLGGTNVPKTGAAAVVDYTSGLLGAIFAAYDLVPLIPLIPLVGLAPLALSTFCANDPPAAPTFTQAEVDAMVNLSVGSPDFATGLGKLKDLALNLAWYDVCACTSGPATPFTPPALPANSPAQPAPIAPLVQPCGPFGADPIVLFQGNTFSRGGPVGLRMKPVQFLHWALDTTINTNTGCPVGFDLRHEQTYPSFSLLHTDSFALTAQEHLEFDLQVWPGADEITVHVTGSTAPPGSSSLAGFSGTVYCSGGGVGSELQCCPPDPTLMAKLDSILSLVTLIQRQRVPFAYIEGTAHPSLSGLGELSVADLIGVRVDFVVPDSAGLAFGDPDVVYDIGTLTIGTADGWLTSAFINHAPFVWLPEEMGVATKVGYTLKPGVTATITELLREP